MIILVDMVCTVLISVELVIIGGIQSSKEKKNNNNIPHETYQEAGLCTSCPEQMKARKKIKRLPTKTPHSIDSACDCREGADDAVTDPSHAFLTCCQHQKVC